MKKVTREKILVFLNNKVVQTILYSPLIYYVQWRILKFVKNSASKVKPGQSIIDLGAGELRHKQYFSHCDYKSQDLCVGDDDWNFENIDIKSSIYEVPVGDGSFDYILCTQVLEHLEFPEKAFAEFNRILKLGGKVFLTAPLGQGEHQAPHDYFRYTKYGLRSLGENHGFKLNKIVPHGGIFISLESVFWESVRVLLPFENIPAMRYFYFLLLFPIRILLGAIFILFDTLDRKKTYTNNYDCTYEKINTTKISKTKF